jgi:UDP-glucose 4-epimerase
MKTIIFGGSGFLGSHVADALSDSGHEVVIYDLEKSPYLKKGQVSVVGNVIDQKEVEEAMEGCEVVYNFAGDADMDEAKKDPLKTVKRNILGNTVLLEASRKQKIKRFIFASTLYVYSNAGSFYRSSKQASELLIENYHEVYGLNFTILRYGSLYGPRASESNSIYQLLKQALIDKKIIRRGDGEELRDYIHVYDAARLSVEALREEYKNQHLIITGNQQIKIMDLLVLVKEMLNNEIDLELVPVASREHYKMTPYNFSPKLAKRIQSNHYVDLGQGILDLMAKIYEEQFPHKKFNRIYVKD